MGLVSISYPRRYDSLMEPVKTSKTVGNIKSDTIEEWVVPMEQKEKGAAPVKIGEPQLERRYTETYKIDKNGNKVFGGVVKKTLTEDKGKYQEIQYYVNDIDYIKKVKNNGKWYLQSFVSPESFVYNALPDGTRTHFSCSSANINDKVIEGLSPKVRKYVVSALNDMAEKIARLKIHV